MRFSNRLEVSRKIRSRSVFVGFDVRNGTLTPTRRIGSAMRATLAICFAICLIWHLLVRVLVLENLQTCSVNGSFALLHPSTRTAARCAVRNPAPTEPARGHRVPTQTALSRGAVAAAAGVRH